MAMLLIVKFDGYKNELTYSTSSNNLNELS